MIKKPTILIADDHPVILEGNKTLLKRHNYDVIYTATNGNEAFNYISKMQPDIAILDMDMPILSGMEVALNCKRKKLKTKIVIFSVYKREEIFKTVGKTIDAYLLKEDPIVDLLKCLQAIQENKTFVSKKIDAENLFTSKHKELQKLTPSELKIIHYLRKDFSSQEISESLFISIRTVEKHRSNIIKKLGLQNNPYSLMVWINQNSNLFEE
ncbi:response regulator transcription factor [Aequorivita sp. Q41]|uniref:response regulator transcription factor n=1 Tax=Aequorivita sp. Q41 TaxID=3153300 RepID=UPI00324256B8